MNNANNLLNYRRLFFSFWIIPFFLAMLVTIEAQSTNQDIYVSSNKDNTIKLYDGETGQFIKNFVPQNSGGLNRPQEVIFGPDGHLYVTAFMNSNIKKYDRETGNFIENFSRNYSLSNPTKMTFNYEDSLIYISQWGGSNKVVRFRMNNGEFHDEFTSTGIIGGCGQAWDSEGNLYVAGWGTNGSDGSVQKFDTAGVFQGVFIPPGRVQGPVNIWFNDNGQLYVQDWTKGSVEIFNSDGTFSRTFISNLQNTEGNVFDEKGNLFLCDWTLNRVNQYDRTGNFLGVFVNPGNGLDEPNSITFGPKYQLVAISENEEQIPDNFELKQNYPNPFNPSTKIEYHLSASGHITLKVFDSIGKEITTLVNGFKDVGKHSINFNAVNSFENRQTLPSGIYFYRLSGKGFSITKKMLILK